MRFEWDPEKDARNQHKHDGIAFSTAALVFNDPEVRFRSDRVVDGEQRWHAIGAVEKAILLVVHVYREENEMAKKSSASSRPAKLISVSAESIFNKQVSKRQKTVLARVAERQSARNDSGIDYSDIPALTNAQLAQFHRTPKVLVATRLDRDVYDWLQQFGKGYSTRINSILRAVMSQAR